MLHPHDAGVVMDLTTGDDDLVIVRWPIGELAMNFRHLAAE